jgi:N-acetylglucosamine-6-sulfatase
MDLKRAGYTTFMGGKYHNDYAAFCDKNVHLPPQFDNIFAFCVDSKYYNISYNQDGVMIKTGDAPTDYMTSQIGNSSLSWIKKAAAGAATTPFFAYIGTHAPHVPATVSDWYMHAPLPATQAPRVPNWNLASPTKHFPVNAQPDMTSNGMAEASDEHFQRRLRSLMSVDDIVQAVYEALSAQGVLDNTYILFTSDHGYNLGTFRLPVEKFHVYENDVRVPLIIRGPGVPANASNHGMVANIDLGETILDLAGLSGRADADGRSFKSLLMGLGSVPIAPALYSALGAPPSAEASTVLIDAGLSPAAIPGWREEIMIEFWSMGYVERGPCTNFSGVCPDSLEALVDAPGNTYVALRTRNTTHNTVYAEFRNRVDSPFPAETNWTELYDMGAGDTWQINNLWPSGVPSPVLGRYAQALWAVANCSSTAGSNCL